jgi:PilZ domain
MSERRLRERVSLDYDLQIFQNNEWKNVVHCRDLSMGGIRFVTDLHIALNESIQLKFQLSESAVEADLPMVVQGKVVYAEFDGNQYVIGVHFDVLGSDVSLFLYRLIAYHKNS